MARYIGPMTKKSRRLGIDLVGDDKAFERRPYPPGVHGKGRTKESEYSLQLREKQKARYSLRRTREAVPPVLRGGQPAAGQDGRQPAPDPGVPPRQRGLSRWAWRGPVGRPVSSWCMVTSLSTVTRSTSPPIGSSPHDVIDLAQKVKDQTPLIINRETHGERDIPGWMQVVPDRGRILIHQLPVAGADRRRRFRATDRGALLEVGPQTRQAQRAFHVAGCRWARCN